MTTAAPAPKAGLEGVVAGDTNICNVEQDALIYRGYEIHDLAQNASFEEVAYLLLEGDKPTADQLKFFKDELIANRALPPQVIDYLKTVKPMRRARPGNASKTTKPPSGALYARNLFTCAGPASG